MSLGWGFNLSERVGQWGDKRGTLNLASLYPRLQLPSAEQCTKSKNDFV